MFRKLLCYLGYHKLISENEDLPLVKNLPNYKGTIRLKCICCDYVSPCVTSSFSFTLADDFYNKKGGQDGN